MPRTCAEFAADLTALAQGELAADRVVEVESHVAACRGCGDALAAIRGVFRMTGEVEDLVPSMRFRRNVEALLAKSRAAEPVREGALWRIRTAAAFIRERIRVSRRFRLAAISVAAHAAVLLALSVVIFPRAPERGPHEFTGTIETPLAGDQDGARPGATARTGSREVELTGPQPGFPQDLLPPIDDPDDALAERGGGMPPADRTVAPAITGLLGSSIDADLKVARLAAFAGEGERTLAAIEKGLAFLAAQQEPDGSWAPLARNPDYRTGVTAAVLLAFLSDGVSHARGNREWRFGVARGVDRLLADQAQTGRDAGLFGPAQGHYAYNHMLATLALVEVYALDHRRLPRERASRIRAAVGQAIGLLARSQTPAGGWRYELRAGATDTDSSVTIFAGMALGAAQAAGFAIPDGVIARLGEWLASTADESGEVGYQRLGDRRGQPPTLTAGALFVGELLGLNAAIRDRQAAIVRAEIEAPHGSMTRNGLLRFYAAMAFRLRGEALLREIAPVVVGRQQADGSFRSGEDLHGVHGGDAFQTALEILTLTTAYHWAGS